MAKKKTEKELTTEEKLEREKQIGISHIQMEVPHINEPSYNFNIGDKVAYGSMKSAVVDDILYDGKVYGLRCIATEYNYGNPYDHEVYRIATWTEVRPCGCGGDTDFARNQDIKLYYNNSTVESLIRKHYFFGVNFEPDYQRGYVWSQEDKELLLDSVFNNIDIGKFVFIQLPDRLYEEGKYTYEILDGKQRLSTLIEFYENKLAYKGKYFNDLSGKDKGVFMRHDVSYAEVAESDRKTVLKYFLMLNRTGKVMDKEHLKAVEDMLKELEYEQNK